MIEYIIKTLVDIIRKAIEELLFQLKIKKQEETIKSDIKIGDDNEKKSDDAANDFLSKYKEYKRKNDGK